MGGISAVYSRADVTIFEYDQFVPFLSNVISLNTSLVNTTVSTYIRIILFAVAFTVPQIRAVFLQSPPHLLSLSLILAMSTIQQS